MAEGGVREAASVFRLSHSNHRSSPLPRERKQANETPFDSSLAQLIRPD